MKTARKWFIPFLCGVLFPGLILAAEANSTREKGKKAYQEALQALEESRCYTALGRLQTSLVLWPPAPDDPEQLQAEYVPYFYMALCYAQIGRTDTARAFYGLAQRRGYIYQIKDMNAKVESLENRLLHPAEPEAPPSTPSEKEQTGPGPSTPPETLPAESTCEVKPAKDPYNLPWYFHYALAKELLSRNRPVPALQSLVLSLQKNPTPHPKSRTYGMWFLEYRPYYYMTQAYLKLQRIDCARATAKQSLIYQEVPPNDPDKPQWTRTLHELGIL